MIENPTNQYRNRKEHFQSLVEAVAREINTISNLRIGIFILGGGGVILSYLRDYTAISIFFGIISVIIFLLLVLRHQRLEDQKRFYEALAKINEEGLQRIAGQWTSFKDTGEEFIDESHPYTQDLDIFGQGSLFQWINTTTTYMGRKRLQELLTNPCQTKGEIVERQKELRELAGKLNWRQELRALGIKSGYDLNDPTSLYKWAKAKDKSIGTGQRMVIKILPIVTITLLLLAFLIGLPIFISLTFIALQVFLLSRGYKKRHEAFDLADRYKKNLEAYRGMLRHWERERFQSPHLVKVQQRLVNQENIWASEQINKLEKINDAISHRKSQLYILMNILLLWDYRCEILLEDWKEQSGIYLETWLESLGEIEALASLALLSYEQPDWCTPTITDEEGIILAEEMGHPLLVKQKVLNDLRMDSPVNTFLITGSNMSGKSTYLRTAGVNLLLAYIGAPVCAKKFTCSLMEIYTCMRVRDSLEENISSFYAELLRIKKIITKVEEGKKVFFLLDEIFKGTNSTDRHTGAKVLIKNLSDMGAVGLVSTHDLELGVLGEEYSAIKNYHFREYYRDDEIHFDYKVREGLSTTRNAIYLMKMAGIKI